jgi:hypothetical protein
MEWALGAQAHFSAGQVAQLVGKAILAPLAAGMLASRFLLTLERLAPHLLMARSVLLIAGALPLLLIAWNTFGAVAGNRAMLALAPFHNRRHGGRPFPGRTRSGGSRGAGDRDFFASPGAGACDCQGERSGAGHAGCGSSGNLSDFPPHSRPPVSSQAAARRVRPRGTTGSRASSSRLRRQAPIKRIAWIRNRVLGGVPNHPKRKPLPGDGGSSNDSHRGDADFHDLAAMAKLAMAVQ